MREPVLLLCCAVAFAASAVVPARAQPIMPPLVSVSGEASVSVPPDSAQVHLGVTSTGKTAREASAANATAMAALIAALKQGGAADKDLQTTRLSLQPTYDPNRGGGSARITGFQATNQVTLRVADTARLSDLIDRAVDAGANDIGGIEFTVAAPSPLLDSARTAAVADARRKAEVYARAAGVKLGRVLSLSEEVGAPGPVYLRAAAAPATPVAPGEQTLHVTVQMSYELLP